jgi:hypothetical protein
VNIWLNELDQRAHLDSRGHSPNVLALDSVEGLPPGEPLLGFPPEAIRRARMSPPIAIETSGTAILAH